MPLSTLLAMHRASSHSDFLAPRLDTSKRVITVDARSWDSS